jgi:hypothetical protein
MRIAKFALMSNARFCSTPWSPDGQLADTAIVMEINHLGCANPPMRRDGLITLPGGEHAIDAGTPSRLHALASGFMLASWRVFELGFHRRCVRVGAPQCERPRVSPPASVGAGGGQRESCEVDLDDRCQLRRA